jgi:pimeloyl-ACP methyl ester carboxylesterase
MATTERDGAGKPQLAFIHGPGAGGCSIAWENQLRHFPDALAPDLPGNLGGTHCADVPRYMEWVRGWLAARGHTKNLVLVGYTLGSSIALQFALDYPDEVSGLVLTAVEIGPRAKPRPVPGHLERCQDAAAGKPRIMDEWIEFQRGNLMMVEPELRERLIKSHRRVGPLAQYKSLVTLFAFDVRDRIRSLKTPLLLIRGQEDPTNPPESEQEIHDAVLGSRLVRLPRAGHFPATERPDTVNGLIEEFLATL